MRWSRGKERGERREGSKGWEGQEEKKLRRRRRRRKKNKATTIRLRWQNNALLFCACFCFYFVCACVAVWKKLTRMRDLWHQDLWMKKKPAAATFPFSHFRHLHSHLSINSHTLSRCTTHRHIIPPRERARLVRLACSSPVDSTPPVSSCLSFIHAHIIILLRALHTLLS